MLDNVPLSSVTGLCQTTLQENTITAQKMPNPTAMNLDQPAKEKHMTSLQTRRAGPPDKQVQQT